MSNNKIRTYGGAAGLIPSGLIAGGVLAGTMTANAGTGTATTPSSTGTAASVRPTNPGDLTKPPRSDETLLTGDTAAKVKVAALAKYARFREPRMRGESSS